MAWSVRAGIHNANDEAVVHLDDDIVLRVIHLGDEVRIEAVGLDLVVTPVGRDVLMVKPCRTQGAPA
jgi:hypothetical protein